MCSSNGTNRVLDVSNQNNPLGSGPNVQIWQTGYDYSQQLILHYLHYDLYAIRMKADQTMFMAVNGTSNGTASGISSTSPGNVYIDTYDVFRSQEWHFELISHPTAAAPTGWFDNVSSEGVSGWAWRSDIPNTPLDIRVYITNTSTNTQNVFVTTADVYRQDLANAGYGDGYHGFSLDINWSVFPSTTYSINVYAVNATGGLTLLSGCPKTYTVTGTSSNVFYGKLDLNDQFTTTLNSGQIHIYTFVPIQTDYYNIFTTGSTDTYGELYNSEFVILNQNDDNDNAYNFKLQHKLYQGVTYYIYVKGYATNTSGNYTINVQYQAICQAYADFIWAKKSQKTHKRCGLL